MTVSSSRPARIAGAHGWRIESITLPQGWTGHILTGTPGPVPGSAISVDLPTREEWLIALGPLLATSFGGPDVEHLKSSPASRVVRISLAVGQRRLGVIAKQAAVGKGLRRFLRSVWPSRQRQNWERALQLLRIGILTPLPLALVERRGLGPESWLLTESIEDLVDVQQLALGRLSRMNAHTARRIKDILIDHVVRLMVALERHGLHHRDLKASNLLVSGLESEGHALNLWLVDLDGLRRSNRSETQRWQPLMRLGASLVSYPSCTRTDCLRFLRAYLRLAGIPVGEWKSHWHRLGRWMNDYLRRSRRSKRNKLDGYSTD